MAHKRITNQSSGESKLVKIAFTKGAGLVEINLKTLTGHKSTYKVDPVNETVMELMFKVRDDQGIPTDQQRMLLDGKQLEHARKLDAYGIAEGSTVHLVLRLRGGGAD